MATTSTKSKYNKVNTKGETPLHLAAKRKHRSGQDFIENLLTKGVDINARNKWGQTPLHYAAIAGCLHNIETLTKSPGINVNSRDINGYNALHSLIAANDGESSDSDDNHDVNCRDINGSNALQSLFAANDDESSELENCLDVNSRDINVSSALQSLIAANDGESPNSKDYLDVNSRDINGSNALQSLFAANDGESSDLEDYLDVNSRDINGSNTLQSLFAANDGESSDLEDYLNVNSKYINGSNALQSLFAANDGERSDLEDYLDVNSRDINEYNALQSRIAANDGESSDSDDDMDDNLFTMESYLHHIQSAEHKDDVDMPEKTLSADFRKSLQVLVNAGIDLNNQTVFGDSILHLIALRDDNPQLLKFFVSNFPDIRLNLINKKNENFLHVYVSHERLEDIVELFVWIADKYSGSSLKALLSSRDICGKTPWSLMIGYTGEAANFQTILEYAVSPNVNDTLGNTLLHQTCGILYGRSHAEFLEYMLKGGADLNAKNMYGESVLSLMLDEEVFDIFVQFNPNFEVEDRWGRSALGSIMKYRPLPDFLEALMETGTVNVNTRDIYGSTPLHFAAYLNFEEQIKLLLEYGADVNAYDNLQERPLDTAKRQRSFRCIAQLKAANIIEQEDTILYTRKPKLLDSTFEEIICELPEAIRSSCIQSPQDIQTLLHLPLNLKDFMNYLLESYHTTSPNYCSEVDSVTSDVNNLVTSLCKQIQKYDSRFKMSVFPSGSIAEGTKVGRPDEFDFILCLDKLNDITDIVMADNSMKKGFASLKFKDIPDVDDYLPFTDADGYFLPILFLRLFYEYLKRALHEPHLWKEGNLYFNVDNKVATIFPKPVLNFDVYWFGSVYKQLKISIDLVPAVYKIGWWPVNIDPDKIPLINSDIKAAGCFLTLQTKVLKMSVNNSHCISRTCNTEDNDEERTKKRMLRISAAPAEICLMKSLPTKFRQAYVLAKILKNVCPEIDVETKQYGLEKIDMEYVRPRRTKPSELLKSYMLKNSVFYVLDELKVENQLEDELDVSQITIKMYNFLLRFVDGGKMHMRPYFLSSDINVFEKSKELSLNKTFIFHLQREFSLKLVLGTLNAKFPKECLAAKIFKFSN